jgi:CheY-like chemotaxis protein
MHRLHLEVATNPVGEEKAGGGLLLNQFPCVVGRQPECEGRLDLPYISRRHCRFFLRDSAVWVEDLGSHNGTFLNRERLGAEPRPIQDGDRLDLGFLPIRVGLAEVSQAAPDRLVPLEMEADRRRILVVEDDPDAAQMLALLLGQLGHEVRVTYDGPEALREAEAFGPDTFLLDLRLPGLDGFEVARRLRERQPVGGARLIGVTGYQDPDAWRRAVEAGMELLLTKPVPPDVLETVILPPRSEHGRPVPDPVLGTPDRAFDEP